MINIALADDHRMFRQGLVSLLKDIEGFSIIGEADNGLMLLSLIATNNPDIVLMDINMPVMDGIIASIEIKKKYPKIKILMLTMHDTHEFIKKMMKIGVDGYLLKTTTKTELQEAIETVMEGKDFYGEDVKDILTNSFKVDEIANTIVITEREKDILILISKEFSTKEISEKLFISRHTIETHRKNLLSKTGSRNVAGLVKFAIDHKFI